MIKNFDDNIEQIYSMCEKEYTHVELITMLKTGDIPAKQLAALQFDKVENAMDALVLLNSLTGCDGKVREAVAYTINKLIISDNKAANIFSELSAETFAKASIDINANICRFIIDIIPYLIKNELFADSYSGYILNFIEESLNELDKFIYKDKKYTINKQLFKLYWCLEAIKYLVNTIDKQILKGVLERCLNINEYTIREKIAEVTSLSTEFKSIKEKLAHDTNYYVKQALNHHCTL